MNAGERRKKISKIISSGVAPVTGSELAAQVGVTRQIVVQDIALLRAGGLPVIATPSGYILLDSAAISRPVKVFACRHETLAQAKEELMIMVNGGGTVRDVIVEHPVYGEIIGSLMLSTPEAVENLIERLSHPQSQMLSSVTGGIHMHTVEAPSKQALLDIEHQLKTAQILI